MTGVKAMRGIWTFAGMALVLSLVRGTFVHLQSTAAPLAGNPSAWCVGGFRPEGHFTGTNATTLPPNARTVGSWNNGDEWQGEAATNWLPVSPGLVRVYVAGYPQHSGCKLTAEFRHADGSITPVDCPIPDPHEEWKPWSFRSSRGTVAVRLVAWDRASDTYGWLAFSEPFATPFSPLAEWFMFGQVFATLALALTLLWGPGLVWTPREAGGELRAVLVLGLGPALLTAAGVAIWSFDGMARPHYLGFVFVAALWAAVGIRLWRRPPSMEAGVMRAIAVAALVVVATTAKATYSGGPEGELYAGTISRTLAVGDRSDARISFHVVQTAAHHFSPASLDSESYFSPWTFFSRGPLAGLAALPIALATAGPPPVAMPDQPWQPFDSTGFAAYRVVLMTLASMVIFALFAVLVPLVGETWAVVGAGLLALCPFGIHDILFTWPKWEATAWVLVSFLFAHRRRPVGAGLALAVGFLFHPLALLWAPWLAIWAAARGERKAVPFLAGGLRFSAGLFLIVLPWMLAGHLAPRAKGSTAAGQLGFFDYFHMADGGAADWSSWWHSRGMNFSNTFVPFWLHFFHEDHPALNAVDGPSPPLVKFAFSWWNTLPLGIGLLVWVVAFVAVARVARRSPATVLLLLIGPALLMCAYWGAHATGLMRECGHPLLAAIIGLTCIGLAQTRGRFTALVSHPAFPWLQLPETLLMLWLTTLLNPRPPPVAFGLLDPLYFAVAILALVATAWILARARRPVA